MASDGQQSFSITTNSASVSLSTITRHKVAVFDGTSNFSLWKVGIKYLLVKEGVAKTLKGMDAILENDETITEEINERAPGTSFSGLSDKVLHNVVNLDITKSV